MTSNKDNRENFNDALICQYRDLIREAIIESEHEHKTRVDIGSLHMKLRVIFKAALYDGLSEPTIHQLIDEAIPEAVAKAA